MAHHKSAKKRNRQRIGRTARNRGVKTLVRRSVKNARLALAAEGTDAEAVVSRASSLLDRAASKNAVPKRRASRLKSRLARQLNRDKSASAAA